jgi:hypothetical protein
LRPYVVTSKSHAPVLFNAANSVASDVFASFKQSSALNQPKEAFVVVSKAIEFTVVVYFPAATYAEHVAGNVGYGGVEGALI